MVGSPEKTQIYVLAPPLTSWAHVTSWTINGDQVSSPETQRGQPSASGSHALMLPVQGTESGQLGFSLGLATSWPDDLENVTEPSWVSVSTLFK